MGQGHHPVDSINATDHLVDASLKVASPPSLQACLRTWDRQQD